MLPRKLKFTPISFRISLLHPLHHSLHLSLSTQQLNVAGTWLMHHWRRLHHQHEPHCLSGQRTHIIKSPFNSAFGTSVCRVVVLVVTTLASLNFLRKIKRIGNVSRRRWTWPACHRARSIAYRCRNFNLRTFIICTNIWRSAPKWSVYSIACKYSWPINGIGISFPSTDSWFILLQRGKCEA